MKGSTLTSIIAIVALAIITTIFALYGTIKPTTAALIVTAIAGLGGYSIKRNGHK